MDLTEFTETKEVSQDEEMVFHYRREDRVKKAPKLVKDYYAGDFKAYRPGLFKALVQTRANRFMFFTLVVCFAVVLALSLFYRKNEASPHGVPLTLSAFSFEETVYVSLEFSSVKQIDYPLTAGVLFEFIDSSGQTVEKQTLDHIYNGQDSFLRTTFHDYDIIKVNAAVLIKDDSALLSAQVQKR